MEYSGSELDLFEKAVHWKKYFGSFFHPYLKGSILEVGAGSGGSTAALCDGTQQSWLCLEPDRDLVSIIDEKIRKNQLSSRCLAVAGTSQDLAGADRFDAVLYIDVLEHISDDRKEISHATAHLKSGGHLLILVPACPILYSPFDETIGHRRRYTKKTIRAIMPASLQEARLLSLDSVGLFASLANKLLHRGSIPSAGQVRFWDDVLVPISQLIDPLLGYRLGKSILGIWKKD